MSEPQKFYDGICPKCKNESTFRYEGIHPSWGNKIYVYVCLNCHERIRRSGVERKVKGDLFK